MNKLAKYIIIATGIAIVLFSAWYFRSILVCILIAAVLSLIGKPFMKLLGSVKIGKFRLGPALSAVITIAVLASVLSLFIGFLTPLIGRIFSQMSAINFEEITQKLAAPLYKYNIMLHNMFPTMDAGITIESMIMDQIQQIVNIDLFTNAVNSIASFLMHFLVDAFTIVFVTFFFLKDSNTFSNMVLMFVPDKYEEHARRALRSADNLLVRYFTGISIEAILITVINTLGLHFIGGVDFQLAVVLAFISGVFNVIPYIGPIAAGAFGTVMGIISHTGDITSGILCILLIKIALIFFFTHLIDVFVFQPLIYSNSVKAHPLEIFLVILVAGHIGGIMGMLAAIPAYTVLRVFAREFFYGFKLVQKLTDKM